MIVRRIGLIAAGTLTALAGSEVALRCLSSPAPPPLPQIERDVLGGLTVTRREIEEGVNVAHFSAGGARLTGNDAVRGAPTIVIVGDSYVVARSVADDETMGAQLERIARDAGAPVNTRQYGWSGASPAQYILAAPQVVARWHPTRVIIPMADNDLDFNALVMTSPRIRVASNGELRVIGASASLSPEPRNASVLAELARHRWYDLRMRGPRWIRETENAIPGGPVEQEAPPDSTELEALPRAVVRALSKAYGPALSLVYLADVRVIGDEAITETEGRFLHACVVERVSCASTRTPMLEARRAGLIARGTSTNSIANGHLNAVGHHLTAKVMWTLIRARPEHPERTATE